MWLGKLTALDMTPLGWLGRKTSTQTNKDQDKVEAFCGTWSGSTPFAQASLSECVKYGSFIKWNPLRNHPGFPHLSTPPSPILQWLILVKMWKNQKVAWMNLNVQAQLYGATSSEKVPSTMLKMHSFKFISQVCLFVCVEVLRPSQPGGHVERVQFT